MQIKPCPGYVAVKPDDKLNKVGELTLAVENNDMLIGRVIDIGECITKDDVLIGSPVGKNDLITYKQYSASKINLEGEDYYLIAFENITAIITN